MRNETSSSTFAQGSGGQASKASLEFGPGFIALRCGKEEKQRLACHYVACKGARFRSPFLGQKMAAGNFYRHPPF